MIDDRTKEIIIGKNGQNVEIFWKSYNIYIYTFINIKKNQRRMLKVNMEVIYKRSRTSVMWSVEGLLIFCCSDLN